MTALAVTVERLHANRIRKGDRVHVHRDRYGALSDPTRRCPANHVETVTRTLGRGAYALQLGEQRVPVDRGVARVVAAHPIGGAQ